MYYKLSIEKRMLGLGGLGRKPRQFSYKPVYWNEEKEMRDELIRSSKMRDPNYKPENDGDYQPGSIIRAGRLRRMKSAEKMQQRSRVNIIRVIIFLLGLGAVFYFLADYIALYFANLN